MGGFIIRDDDRVTPTGGKFGDTARRSSDAGSHTAQNNYIQRMEGKALEEYVQRFTFSKKSEEEKQKFQRDRMNIKRAI